jgi:hypothetical protein
MEKLTDVYTVIKGEGGYTTHYKNGVSHRDERDENGALLPAEYNSEHTHMEWKQNGEYVRENDLPTLIDYGDQYWYTKQGKLFRDTVDANGNLLPAVIRSSGMEYYVDGQASDGPAIIFSDGVYLWYTVKGGYTFTRPN